MFTYSPADRGTKKHVYLPCRGAIPFLFYLVPLRLVSIFLNVGHFEIYCGFLPTRFLSILLQNCITVKKGSVSSSILEKITCIIRKLVKN